MIGNGGQNRLRLGGYVVQNTRCGVGGRRPSREGIEPLHDRKHGSPGQEKALAGFHGPGPSWPFLNEGKGLCMQAAAATSVFRSRN